MKKIKKKEFEAIFKINIKKKTRKND